MARRSPGGFVFLPFNGQSSPRNPRWNIKKDKTGKSKKERERERERELGESI
jgi:hypothetical protein